jgi:hypothetical protein
MNQSSLTTIHGCIYNKRYNLRETPLSNNNFKQQIERTIELTTFCITMNRKAEEVGDIGTANGSCSCRSEVLAIWAVCAETAMDEREQKSIGGGQSWNRKWGPAHVD